MLSENHEKPRAVKKFLAFFSAMLKVNADLTPMYIFHPYLTSQKIFLRRLTEKDAPELCQRITSTIDSLNPWMDWAIKPYHIQYAQERIFSHESQWSSPMGSRAYGIFSMDDGSLIGEISAHHIELIANHTALEESTAQLGYWICLDYQKKALMREAVTLMTRYLLEAQSIQRVYVYCEAGNERSIQLPRALGFTENPMLKSFTVNLLTKLYNDVHVFSRSSSDGLPIFSCSWSDQPVRSI